MRKYILVIGTTVPRDVQLKDDDVAMDGTAWDIALDWRDTGLTEDKLYAVGNVTVAWLDQAAGTIRLTGMGSLPLGTYYLRYVLTDGGGNIDFAPNETTSDEWRVVPV